jgi:uncharacterized membrane protein
MMRRRDKQEQMLDLILLTLALAGLAINVLLLSRHWPGGGGSIAGCGGGDCAEVLASRWAYVFRMPVAVFGTLAYLLLLLSFIRRWRFIQMPVLAVITGAAAWFLLVQSLLLGRYCAWCLAAHSLAISLCAITLIRMLRCRQSWASYVHFGGWTAGAFLVLGLAQIYGPTPITHRIDDSPSAAAHGLTAQAGNAASSPGRPVGRMLDDLPLLGSPSAQHVLVEYFDYRCTSCRELSQYLAALIARHPDQIAVRLAPVPMDRLCNSYVPAGAHKPDGCEIAKTAIVVWQHAPRHFPEFHRKLFADPSPAAARREACSLMTAEELDDRLTERHVMEMIRANVAYWRRLSMHNEKLPKLIIREKRILHGLPPSEEEFLRVMQQELGL